MKQEIKELKEKVKNNDKINDLKEENRNMKEEEIQNMKEKNLLDIKNLKEEIEELKKEIIKQENSYSIISDKNHSFNLIFQNLNSIIGISASYQDDIIKHNYEKK